MHSEKTGVHGFKSGKRRAESLKIRILTQEEASELKDGLGGWVQIRPSGCRKPPGKTLLMGRNDQMRRTAGHVWQENVQREYKGRQGATCVSTGKGGTCKKRTGAIRNLGRTQGG